MARYDEELLSAALRLVRRRSGQRGRLSNARIRRSISTSYYALFHFLLDEGGNRLIGSSNDLLRRKRVFVRTFTRAGIKTALDKVRGTNVDQAVADFLRQPGAAAGPVLCPAFAQVLAKSFADAQAKRHDADYDLNKQLSETDARLLRSRVKRAIDAWRAADAPSDRDFKHALCMLMLLKGQLRRDQ
jgi:hypothetical protein